MSSMRRGFTMIELIFVIVVIGVLTAVAIPKLTATRDDASISICAHELSLFQREVSAYYTGHRELSALGDITNILTNAGSKSGFSDQNTTDLNVSGASVHYVCEGGAAATFTYINDGNGTVNLTVDKATSLSALGKSVADLMDTKGFFRTYKIGGSSGLAY